MKGFGQSHGFAVPQDQKAIRRSLGVVFLAYITYSTVISTLTIVLPRIAADLNGMHLFSWALAFPGLARALSALLFGKLPDLHRRRALFLLSLTLYLLGAGWSVLSRAFEMLLLSLSVLGAGQGALAPLCFAVLGDLFRPTERSRWAGLLNLPGGIMALIGPVLCGWLVDHYDWRYLFAGLIPFILASLAGVALLLPAQDRPVRRTIDALGSILLAAATTTLLLGLSWAGDPLARSDARIVGLIAASLMCWAAFVRVEAKAQEPFLDPHLLLNRVFLSASLSALLSCFGLLTVRPPISPLFLQGVQSLSAAVSGQVMTPFSVSAAFLGVPAGFLLSRTRRYRGCTSAATPS